MQFSRLVGAISVMAGLATLLLAVRTARADNSPYCDSNQVVLPSAIGQQAPGGPDPDNPNHWEPVGGSTAGVQGMTCANVSCAGDCIIRVEIYDTPNGSPPMKRRTFFCNCQDTNAMSEGDQPEGVFTESVCRIRTYYVDTLTWDGENFVYVQTASGVECALGNCTGGQTCKFHVTTVGVQKIADCNCQ